MTVEQDLKKGLEIAQRTLDFLDAETNGNTKIAIVAVVAILSGMVRTMNLEREAAIELLDAFNALAEVKELNDG